MSIVFSAKLFSGVVNDTFLRYSDPSFNELIASAEKFYLEVKGTVVTGSPTLAVQLETSNDNINWSPRTAAISGVAFVSNTPLFASDFVATGPVGRYARYSLKFTAGGATGGYVELWVTGRDAR